MKNVAKIIFWLKTWNAFLARAHLLSDSYTRAHSCPYVSSHFHICFLSWVPVCFCEWHIQKLGNVRRDKIWKNLFHSKQRRKEWEWGTLTWFEHTLNMVWINWRCHLINISWLLTNGDHNKKMTHKSLTWAIFMQLALYGFMIAEDKFVLCSVLFTQWSYLLQNNNDLKTNCCCLFPVA